MNTYTERYDFLMSHPLDEILESKLLIELLRLWSIAFNGKQPCSTCRPDHLKYHKDLLTSRQIFEMMDNQKFLLKSGIAIQTVGRIYRIDNTTDEDAIKLLKMNKVYIKQFEKFPKEWESLIDEPQTASVEEVKPKRTRTVKASE